MSNSPVVVSNFWKERYKCENSLNFSSTVNCVMMGKIKHIPVSQRFAVKLRETKVNNPFTIATTLKRNFLDRREKFPNKLYGDGKIKLPVFNKNFNALTK